jgi:hypothetical protein
MNFTTSSLIRDEKYIVESCSLVMGEGTRTYEDQYLRKDMYVDIFWEVVNVDQLQWYEYKTMKGTHGFHLV